MAPETGGTYELNLGSSDCPRCGAMLVVFANTSGRPKDGKIVLRPATESDEVPQ